MAKQSASRVTPAETELKEKLVQLNRVAKVTKGGRTFSFAAIVVVGDGKGTVGHGLGKARDVSEAISKAVDDAKKNLVRVPIYKGTIPHEVKGKFKAGSVLIKPASDGTGVIAGGAMRAVLEIAGVHNVLAKSQGSSNPHNVVKATITALSLLRDPGVIAKQRNISLEKMFNG
ncbi:30S ribosomal protein S5 [Haliscomenobacter hydrossis]|uniref:Small ribosomal subunit protein uS5 n=1 Tax=Haliscomenobacter hydrossis (strain ATCC 27775 / DSM 1100 / LMG 10767 / O) TaxID=760192 RepID=F4KXT4_HALH1|nr:30S ribosomal protein S5 [Haliscomenobacter hydrossis]AEE52593.1 ribosomal protein S5 [Haliscomenobacter hydrossis DSM 1100]